MWCLLSIITLLVIFTPLANSEIADEFMQQFGQEMLQRDSIIVTKYAQNEESANAKFITINHTTFVSSSTICFSLPQETTTFTSVTDYFTIQSRLPSLDDTSELNRDVNCNSYAEYGSFLVSLDLLGRQIGSPADDFVLTFEYFDENRQFSIEIDEVIQALPEVNGVRRCSDTRTQETCMDECRVSAIKDQCNCTLRSDATKTARSGCSWTILKKCLPEFSMINASHCIDNCLPSCEQVHYYWNSRIVLPWQILNNTGCELGMPYIGLSSFQYQSYSEQLQWSFYSYVAGLGGVLHILIGIDVILLIECLLAVANWLNSFVGWCSTKLKKKTNQNVDRVIKIGPSGNKRGKSKIIVVRPAVIVV